MHKRKKSKDVLIPVLIITVLFWLACVVCFVISRNRAVAESNRRKELVENAGTALTEVYAEKKAEVARTNSSNDATYQANLQNYISELRNGYQDAVVNNDPDLQNYYKNKLAEVGASVDGTSGVPWPEAAKEGWDVVDLSSYAIDKPVSVELSRQDMLYNGMLLVNLWHERPADFDDNAPVKVHTYSKSEIRVSENSVALLESAANAWMELITDAKIKHGYNYFMLENAHRTYDDQKKRYESSLSKVDATDYETELALQTAILAKYKVFAPGHSDYNAGLSAYPRLYKSGDSEINNKDKNFFTSEEGLWLYEHSWEYGLVFRYPVADYPVRGTVDKSYITGVNFEMRVFRYVGRGNAAAMHALDLCLEEYIEYLKVHPHIAVYEDGNLRYEIYREYVGDADTVTVTQSDKGTIADTESSLDNMGYVVTVFEY